MLTGIAPPHRHFCIADDKIHLKDFQFLLRVFGIYRSLVSNRRGEGERKTHKKERELGLKGFLSYPYMVTKETNKLNCHFKKSLSSFIRNFFWSKRHNRLKETIHSAPFAHVWS